MQLARQARCPIYGPILAVCLVQFSWDLVDLICGYIYPEALPNRVLQQLLQSTSKIELTLSKSPIQYPRLSHIQRFDPGSFYPYWAIASGSMDAWTAVSIHGFRERDGWFAFSKSQRNFTYKVSYEQERDKRQMQFIHWVTAHPGGCRLLQLC